jgi:hypothetical protein
MLKRAGSVGRVVAIALVVFGLGGLDAESVAQSDMKKDDKMKMDDTMKTGDKMQSGDTMKSGDTTMKGEKKGDMKADEMKKDKMMQGDQTMEKK